MCCVIFSKVNQNPHIEIGINFAKEFIDDIENLKFFENNFNKGKVFINGPLCNFRGKHVPYFM